MGVLGGASVTVIGRAPATAAALQAETTRTASAALEFLPREYAMQPLARRFLGNERVERVSNVPSAHSFGRLETVSREAPAPAVSFSVEDHGSPPGFTFCDTDSLGSTCHDIRYGVRPAEGMMFVTSTGGAPPTGPRANAPIRDAPMWGFRGESIVVGAADDDSSLKIYRSIHVAPPAQVPTECADFPEQDVHRYRCLFNGPLSPGAPAPATGAMKDDLPSLVQDADHYELVFREEFTGTTSTGSQHPGGCTHEVAGLDSGTWHHRACARVDGAGEPCSVLGGGKYTAGSARTCRAAERFWDDAIYTDGLMRFKYGYVEIKATLPIVSSSVYANYNSQIGNPHTPEAREFYRYGIALDSREAVARTIGGVVSLFEFVYRDRHMILHTNMNHRNYSSSHLWHRDTSTILAFCERSTHYNGNLDAVYLPFRTPCRGSHEVDVTIGVEWTPRGYREFYRVDGLHEELQLIPESSVLLVDRVPCRRTRGYCSRWITGVAHDRRHELLDDGDPDSHVRQWAIPHRALGLTIGAWAARTTELTVPFSVDYIRVWQPTNNYSDMEPVYE